ncbi:MAG: hypothetical protein AB7L65_03890 [Hyphomonadaceae bacterium]
MSRYAILSLWMGLLLSACGAAGPPPALAGLWSVGPAACAAGVGLTFGRDAIAADYGGEREILFANPRYQRMPGGRLRIRIRYDLPAPQGENARTGMRGVLVMERRDDGWLQPVSHQIEDVRTGARRLHIGADPMDLALTVRPCAVSAWIPGLRGRGPG